MKSIKIVSPFNSNDNKSTFGEICEALRPIFLLMRCLGLLPTKLASLETDADLKNSKSDLFYVGSFVSVYIVMTAFSIIQLSLSHDYVNIVPKMVIITENSVVLGFMFLLIFFAYVMRRLSLKNLKLLAETDDCFKTIDVEMNYKLIFKNCFMLLGAMGCSSVIRAILNLSSLHINFLLHLTFFIAVLIKSTSKYCFVLFLLPVAARFEKINDMIKAYFDKENMKVSQQTDHDHSDMLTKLYTICRLHYKLCNISRLLNTSFAFQLLFSLGVSLTNILFQSYYLYIALSNKHGDATPIMVLASIVWLVNEILEVYLLVYACSTTCDNANGTSILLHELRNNISNAKLETHIQMYSLQMLHQKLQFSALGFFEIDYTLIYSIIGSVTTYLVIFIQFDQTQDTTATTTEEVFTNNCTMLSNYVTAPMTLN